MESDCDSSSRPIYHTCITVYPLLIRRIVTFYDKNRLLNEFIFAGDNAHHEKYMITSSGNIENGQFVLYFTNNISQETIYETMKGESSFNCTIPKQQFVTEPNNSKLIPQIMRKWQWKQAINLNQDFTEYSFENCYQIEHAIENKHDSVVLSIKEDENMEEKNENYDENQQQQRKKMKKDLKSLKNKKFKNKNHHKRKSKTDLNKIENDYISSWHLIIFNKEFAEKNKNVASINKTDQIEIESETFHQGMITQIDHNSKKGFVSNKIWKCHHSFSINPEIYDQIKPNQLISFSLFIPKSCYLQNESQQILAKDCIANNIDIMSDTLLLRPKSARLAGLQFIFIIFHYILYF